MNEIKLWIIGLFWPIAVVVGWAIGSVLHLIRKYAFPRHCREAVDQYVAANIKTITLRQIAKAMWSAWRKRAQLAAIKREGQQRRANLPPREKREFKFKDPT